MNTKPGVMTTEFWGTGAAISAATALLQNGSISEYVWCAVVVGSLVAYIISRTSSKVNGKGGETNGTK